MQAATVAEQEPAAAVQRAGPTPAQIAAILKAVESNAEFSGAAAAGGVSADTLREWMDADPWLAEQIDAANEPIREKLREQIRNSPPRGRRGRLKWERYVAKMDRKAGKAKARTGRR